MQLIPSRNFTVVRQIGNHTDPATYYVRAVIRNAYTDVILDTLNLTDKGSLRFKKDWLVPQETSGLGGFISIVTSVYDDSGYTTKSVNYADEENTYLWATLALSNGGGGGGFSEKFDYRRVRQIVEEVVATIPLVPAFPEMPEPKEYEMKWDEVLAKCDEMMTHMKSMPQENNDDAPIMAKIDDVLSAIEAKEVTDVTDLNPIIERIEESEESWNMKHEEIRATLDSLTASIEGIPAKTESLFNEMGSEEQDLSTKLIEQLQQRAQKRTLPQKRNVPPVEEPVDYEGIANSLSQ